MVSVPCWHATPVANAPWKPLIIGEGQARYQGHEIGISISQISISQYTYTQLQKKRTTYMYLL